MLREWFLGDRSPLPFDVLLSLRSQFLHHPAPAVLAICAIAASVALAASVEIASRSVDLAIRRSMDAIAGATQVEVTSASQGVQEELIDELRNADAVQSASPIVEDILRIVVAGGSEEPVRVVGMDLLYDREVREYDVTAAGLVIQDHIRLVADKHSIILAARLAERLGVSEGDRVSVRSRVGRHELVVRGILVGTLANAYGGSLALMDVYALQNLLGMSGVVTRIDIAGRFGATERDLLESVRAIVGERATARVSTLRENVVVPVLGAYSFGVWAITLIGVLLALFLTYAVVSVVVDRRIVEFALLRAAGMDARRASRAVVVDACILAMSGTVVGLVLAAVFAESLVMTFSGASMFYQDLAIEPARFSYKTALFGIAVGVPMAVIAGVEPALRAGRRRPLDVLYRRGDLSTVRHGFRLAAAVGIVLLVGFVVALGWTELPPGPRLGAIVGTGVLATWVLAGVLMPAMLPLVQEWLARSVPRIGVLAGASLGDRPIEAGLTVAIWSAVVAAAVGLLTSLSGLGRSMDEYLLGESGSGAIFAFSEDPATSAPSSRLPVDLWIADVIRGVDGVRGAWASRSARVMFAGEEVRIDDYDVPQLIKNGGLRGISNDTEESLAALHRGELLASDAFLRRFRLKIGDTITLSTTEGPREFRIGGGARSFDGPRGRLCIAADEFSRWFRSRGAENIVFWVSGPSTDVLPRVRSVLGDTPIFFREGEAVRMQARRAVGRFSSLLMVPLAVVGVIGLIGLINLLVGNVAARRRDLSLIRASGGTTWNLVAVVGLSAALIALAGTGAGIGIGISWAVVIRDAITEFLGWRMSIYVDWKVVAVVCALALCAAVCAAAASAVATRRASPFQD